MDLYPAQTHAILDKEPQVGIFRNTDLDASLWLIKASFLHSRVSLWHSEVEHEVHHLWTRISLPSSFNSREQSRERNQRNRRWPLCQRVKQCSSFLPFIISGVEWTQQTLPNCSFSGAFLEP